jgi:hypothetical protein
MQGSVPCAFLPTTFADRVVIEHPYNAAAAARLTHHSPAHAHRSLCGLALPSLLAHSRIAIPIHASAAHWACAVIDLLGCRILYYDSLPARTVRLTRRRARGAPGPSLTPPSPAAHPPALTQGSIIAAKHMRRLLNWLWEEADRRGVALRVGPAPRRPAAPPCPGTATPDAARPRPAAGRGALELEMHPGGKHARPGQRQRLWSFCAPVCFVGGALPTRTPRPARRRGHAAGVPGATAPPPSTCSCRRAQGRADPLAFDPDLFSPAAVAAHRRAIRDFILDGTIPWGLRGEGRPPAGG